MPDHAFAFAIHPIHPKADVARRFPLLARILSEEQIHRFSAFWPPVYISKIEGVRSAATGQEAPGWFVAVPLTPRQMLSLPVERVYRKIVATGGLAERLGAQIMGLGAFISVVGDAGATVSERLHLPVTTGNSYTVSIVVQALEEACRQMDIDIGQARVAVVGAAGSIGAASAELLADHTAELILIGRRQGSLDIVRERCEGRRARIITSLELDDLKGADAVLSATSAVKAVIEPQHLKPGAVVCDAAVPADVSRQVRRQRDDVLVIEGGMVQVPGTPNFNFNFGYPPGKVYACMAETMALALEGRYEDFSIGRNLDIDRVREIAEIAGRHGFRLAGLTSREREVTQAYIDRVRERADDRRTALGHAAGAAF